MSINNGTTFKNVYLFFKLYKGKYIVLGMLLVLKIIIELGFATFLLKITDAAINKDVDTVILMSKYGLCLIVSYSLLNYLYTYCNGIYTSQVRKDIKNKVFEQLLNTNSNVFQEKDSGDLVSRITNDINIMCESLIHNLIMIIFMPVMAITSFIYIANLYWKLAIFSIVLGPVALILSIIFSKLINKYSKSLYVELSHLNDLLIDSFLGVKIIKVFSLEKIFINKNKKQNLEIYNCEKKINHFNALFQACMGIVLNSSFVVSIGLGTFLIVKGEITIGILTAFITLLNHVVEPFTVLGNLITQFAKSVPAIERVYELIHLPVSKTSVNIKEDLEDTIELKNFTFTHQEKVILDNISLKIPINKTVAIVGPSGSGKTTLLNALMNLEYKYPFTIVNQNGYLFKTTIKENISFGKPSATMDEIINAAKLANIHEYILSLPNGYETVYGKDNIQLSGGEQQRIIIARAIINNAPVIFLDEAMTALDNKNQEIIINNLKQFLRNKTGVIVTHQIHNIIDVDLIIVMNKGKIVEMGTHTELINNKGLYYDLFDKQRNLKSEEGIENNKINSVAVV
ncbi:ABC transporter ATP-binding protein [Bacillus wiedmannii]|uniref:ABC transporter ATP-binding protein n=1 Tax=Bacillus wiedmannii TaxID=1890302 RepID=UPI0028533C52|nr:ABC transporter ATP-binding protein [Bacillus wiedmannii]MDR4943005.1 ABC transporter ATP-binding protein [Bacillus wiedmannii]